MRSFTSTKTVESENNNAPIYPIEMLNTLSHGSVLPGHMLSLKKGFILILLRNLDLKNGHVNETLYVVENMTNNVLFLGIDTGIRKGSNLTLPQISCRPGHDSFPVPGFKLLHFPVLEFFVIMKSTAQGKSFGEKLVVYLCRDFFCHDQ